MDVKGLGKITVATGGTPVQFSSTLSRVSRVFVSFDSADTTSTVYVKDADNNIIAALKDGNPTFIIGCHCGWVDMRKLYADSNGNGKGPYVGYEVS